MLGDENFYDIVESDWAQTGLSEDLRELTKEFVQRIYAFKEDDLPYKQLAINKDWLAIVDLAKKIQRQMAAELSIDAGNPPAW